MPAALQRPASLDGAEVGETLTLVAAKREEGAGNSCQWAEGSVLESRLASGGPGALPMCCRGMGAVAAWEGQQGDQGTPSKLARVPGRPVRRSELRETRPLGSWVGWFRSRLHL